MAVVVPKYGLVGGGERFARELTEKLARDARYEFHVFANRWSPGPGPIVYHTVPMLRFPRSLRPLSFDWFAGRMVAKGRFDIVHAHERVRRADVFTMHAVPHRGWIREVRRKREGLFDRATIRLERAMMANAAASWFMPVSTLAADALQKEYEVDPARIRIVHPGVDFARFSGPDRAACRGEIRARHGIGPNDTLVLFVGMNFEVKGLGAVVAAVGKARRERPEAGFRLLVVGRGDRDRYTALAGECGAAGAVAFAGPVAEGVERYYRAADLFAMPSAFDTFGMAVLEAMAAGLPVIVSPFVGAKDLVEDGANGYVARGGQNHGSVAEAVAALADPGLRARLGAAAQDRARAQSWDAAARRVLEIYDAVAGGR